MSCLVWPCFREMWDKLWQNRESRLRCPHTLRAWHARKNFGVRLCHLQVCDTGEIICVVRASISSSTEWFNNTSFTGLLEDETTVSHPDMFLTPRASWDTDQLSLWFPWGFTMVPGSFLSNALHSPFTLLPKHPEIRQQQHLKKTEWKPAGNRLG